MHFLHICWMFITHIPNPLQFTLSKVHYKSFNSSLTSISCTDNIILSNKRNLIVTPDRQRRNCTLWKRRKHQDKNERKIQWYGVNPTDYMSHSQYAFFIYFFLFSHGHRSDRLSIKLWWERTGLAKCIYHIWWKCTTF